MSYFNWVIDGWASVGRYLYNLPYSTMGEGLMKQRGKRICIALILLLGGTATFPAIQFLNYTSVYGVVQPLNANVSYIELHLRGLQGEYEFSEWYEEVIRTDVPCNLTVHLDVLSLSDAEIDALGNPHLTVYIRKNNTVFGMLGGNLSSWYSPINFTGSYPVDAGNYDIGIGLIGKTGVPVSEEIDFRMIVELKG